MNLINFFKFKKRVNSVNYPPNRFILKLGKHNSFNFAPKKVERKTKFNLNLVDYEDNDNLELVDRLDKYKFGSQDDSYSNYKIKEFIKDLDYYNKMKEISLNRRKCNNFSQLFVDFVKNK